MQCLRLSDLQWEPCGVGRRVYIFMSKPARTDAGFRDRVYENHQTPRPKSILFESNIDMIRCFVIDYMHCVCLGTIKRFLLILGDGVLLPEDNTRTPFHIQAKGNVGSIDGRVGRFLPFEFNRKGRPISDLCR